MQGAISEKYNAFKTAGGNAVWGGALSLAWNDLKKTFKLHKIEFVTEDPHIIEVANNFNSCPFKQNDIADDSIYIKTGYGQETVKEINANINKKFPKATIGQIDFKLEATDIIAYAYLNKIINFKVKFDRRQEEEFLFNSIPVSSFFARTDEQKKQVVCNYYQNQNDFVVHIPDAEGKDLLFLIKSSKQLTLDQVITKVNSSEKKESSRLTKNDFFEMPNVILKCQRELKEFKGLRFANPALKHYEIAVILEKMVLNINQSGAKVENMGVIVSKKGKALRPDPIVPKYIILDRTFWVVMKEPGKHPYFCAQITTPVEEN